MSVSNLCLAINSIKRLPEPCEAYSCRQGPGISLEIETSWNVVYKTSSHEVARGLASRLRLKHYYPCSIRPCISRRQGPGISLEIETRDQPMPTMLQVAGRQGPGISLEIETIASTMR